MTDGRFDGRTSGRTDEQPEVQRQIYIPPPSAWDKKCGQPIWLLFFVVFFSPRVETVKYLYCNVISLGRLTLKTVVLIVPSLK